MSQFGYCEYGAVKQCVSLGEGVELMTVTVYSTTTCPYCKMLMNYLNEKNVKYEKKLVDQDEVVREEMTKISGGFLGVPYTVIDKDGSLEKIVGFDKAKINAALGIE